MNSPGAETEAMLVRTTVVNLALQTLVGRLVSNGTLNRADLLAMRETGLQLAADPQRHRRPGRRRPAGGLMAAWWNMADAMSAM